MKNVKSAQDRWYIQELTCPQLLNRNALQFGDRRFQWWKKSDGTLESNTYTEVWRLVKEMASGLMEFGIEKGDRVAVLSHTAPQWVWADYSTLCAAGVTVCIYPTLSESEIAYIINDSGSKIIYVYDETLLKKILNIRSQTPSLKKVILLTGDVPGNDDFVISLSQLRKKGETFLARDKDAYDKRWRSVEMTDLMTIVYTSGTTGMPRGAVHTHQSFNAACCRDCLQVLFSFNQMGIFAG